MSAFRLHPQAVRELDDIWEYIAADTIPSAERVIDELESACVRLSKAPRAGHLRPDIAGNRLRFWRVRDYLIAYAPETTPVLVLGFIHGARDPKKTAIILKARFEDPE
jgi:toxin ParE1/3/4